MSRTVWQSLFSESLKWLREPDMHEVKFFARLESEKKRREELKRLRDNWKSIRFSSKSELSEYFKARNRISYARNRDKRVSEAREKRVAMKSNAEAIEKYRKYSREKQALRFKNDPVFRTRKRIRGRILIAVKRRFTDKSFKTLELLGCDIKTLMSHIESQFKPGMTWDNHGKFGWHIDHIRPCASFDLSDPEQQKKCFHYSNLQPLWRHENLSKGYKVK